MVVGVAVVVSGTATLVKSDIVEELVGVLEEKGKKEDQQEQEQREGKDEMAHASPSLASSFSIANPSTRTQNERKGLTRVVKKVSWREFVR